VATGRSLCEDDPLSVCSQCNCLDGSKNTPQPILQALFCD
jgi:hypothetical protein